MIIIFKDFIYFLEKKIVKSKHTIIEYRYNRKFEIGIAICIVEYLLVSNIGIEYWYHILVSNI